MTTKSIWAIVIALGSMYQIQIFAGLGALMMNEIMLSDSRLKARLNNNPFIEPTLFHKAIVIIYGIFIATTIYYFLDAKFMIDDKISQAVAGLIGGLTPHIIGILRDSKFVRNLIEKRISQ